MIFEEKKDKSQDKIIDKIKRYPYLFLSLSFLCLIISGVIFSYFSQYNGLDFRDTEQLAWPSLSHLFGTDPDGRDIFLRTIIGTKAYFLPGLLACSISLILGILLGILGSSIWEGVVGKGVIFLSNCLLDIIESFPKYILILLMITIIKEPNFYHIMIILGIINSPKLGKVIRGKIESLKKRHFIEAAEALGLGKLNLVFRHILYYNCLSIFIIHASLQMAEVILLEIGLSYLGTISNWGLGVTIKEPMPSFGNILVIGKDRFFVAGWWIVVFPLMVVVLNILTFYWLSDELNEKFGVKKVNR